MPTVEEVNDVAPALQASRSGPRKAAVRGERLMPEPFYVGSAQNTLVMFAISSEGEFAPELRNGCRRLGRFILPPFQRPPVWSREQQIKLIESVWLELPIGVFIYNACAALSDTPEGECDQWLVDGQQRITALLEYVHDAFPVFGYRYSEVSERDVRAFMMKAFPCVELKNQLPGPLKDIYERLAYGGTPHEASLLDRSEMAKPGANTNMEGE